MTNRERIIAALHHLQPDRVPYHIGFTRGAHEHMVRFYGDAGFENKLGNCFRILDTKPHGAYVEVKPGIFRDQFGVEWNRSVDRDIGVVSNRVVTPATLDDFEFPDADDPTRYEYENVIESTPDGFFVVTHGFSLFERAWTLCGMETLLAAMIDDPKFVHELLDRILEFNLRVIDNVMKHRVDAMLFGDDWGQQSGLIMGPRLWREFIRPRIREMYQRVRSAGRFVFIHSCGKVDEIFPDLIECGVNVFNPFQPEAMDVFEIKRRFGRDLCFYGGVSTQRALPFGTPSEMRTEVKRLMDEIGRDGGYFLAPAHSIPADARPENIAAMIECLQEQ